MLKFRIIRIVGLEAFTEEGVAVEERLEEFFRGGIMRGRGMHRGRGRGAQKAPYQGGGSHCDSAGSSEAQKRYLQDQLDFLCNASHICCKTGRTSQARFSDNPPSAARIPNAEVMETDSENLEGGDHGNE